MRMSLHTAIRDIGLVNLARQLGITKQRLNGWRAKGIPLEEVPRVEAVTGVPRELLKPEIDWSAFCKRRRISKPRPPKSGVNKHDY